ncbi:MAG: DGQHR domain-containing protein [Aeriscardovia sp.]|nr:DGQHR domain-containing protein [Aeriscardovia sp.]
MQRLNLQKITQNGQTFYSLVTDPRIVVEMIHHAKAKATQDNQRPWDPKRVKEIAAFVDGHNADDESGNQRALGIIPNSPILNICGNLEIHPEGETAWMDFPASPEEAQENFADTFDVIDGQHRILAFGPDYCHISRDEPYQMIFSVFYRASRKEKKELFMVTNEKQKQVPANLLRQYREQLGLLSTDDGEIYQLIELLDEEDFSPLKDRVIMGAESIRKGFKEVQIAKILKKYGAFDAIRRLTSDPGKRARLISDYLKAWEKEYEVRFAEPDKNTLTKVAGLRYVLVIFPLMLTLFENERRPATDDNIRSYVHGLRENVLAEEAGTDQQGEDIFSNQAFSSESATVRLAKKHEGDYQRSLRNNNQAFNILEGR